MSVDDDSIPIPTSIIKYDSVFDGTPKEYGFVHWDHCAKCHLTSCPFEKWVSVLLVFVERSSRQPLFSDVYNSSALVNFMNTYYNSEARSRLETR